MSHSFFELCIFLLCLLESLMQIFLPLCLNILACLCCKDDTVLQHHITDNYCIKPPVYSVGSYCIRSNRQTESLKFEIKLKIKGEVNNTPSPFVSAFSLTWFSTRRKSFMATLNNMLLVSTLLMHRRSLPNNLSLMHRAVQTRGTLVPQSTKFWHQNFRSG